MSSTIEEYILTHIDEEPPLLKEMNREAHVRLLHPGMLSGHLQGRLLKMFVEMIRPQQVLEIGTFTGYSALCMAEGLSENAHLHTIEIDDEMEEMIRNNFRQSAYEDKITLHLGDANELVSQFEDEFFDLAFMDADKRDYWTIFEKILPKIKQNGFIVADNTLWYGKVLEKPESNDWQTKGILDFNDKLARDERVEKVILPIRDGLTLIRKK